jgi:CTP-dependent riboflavin kinase
MRVFAGTVTTGYGMAARNLDPVMSLIEQRAGLLHLVRGTLNVTIREEYIVRPDAVVLPEEYPFNKESGLHETIKFQRCLVAGHRGLIVRPDTHELGAGQFHGKSYLELMGQKNFREALALTDGSAVEVQVEGDDAWWHSGI